MNTTKKLAFILPALFFAGNEIGLANSDLSLSDSSGASSIVSRKSVAGKKETFEAIEPVATTKEITIEDSGNSYQPYIQFGGTRFFNVRESNAATTADLFIPIWQDGLTDLVFTDLRINDRSGTPFEGNIHLGYRHLFSEMQQLLGIYGAFDRKKTQFGNYFNQLTVGAECWMQDWFVGANYYRPIGSTKKLISRVINNVTPIYPDQAILGYGLRSDKAMPGVDAEVGYEFIEGLVGYAGGYYFSADSAATIYGPRARLSYDWSLNNGRRILGIFDKVGLEAGIQRDKPRGVTGYLSVNARIGWLFDKKTTLQGISRHMIDPVRRDIDIVSTEVVSHETKILSSDDLLNRIFEKDPGYPGAAPEVKMKLNNIFNMLNNSKQPQPQVPPPVPPASAQTLQQSVSPAQQQPTSLPAPQEEIFTQDQIKLLDKCLFDKDLVCYEEFYYALTIPQRLEIKTRAESNVVLNDLETKRKAAEAKQAELRWRNYNKFVKMEKLFL